MFPRNSSSLTVKHLIMNTSKQVTHFIILIKVNINNNTNNSTSRDQLWNRN